MAEDKTDNQTTLVERWVHEQQEWQKTALSYLDSMVKSDDFLVHLGNAMRGSLLAGKPYPTADAAKGQAETPLDDRLDQILFALHQLEGQMQDVRLTLDEIRAAQRSKSTKKLKDKHKSPKRASSKRKDDE